MIINALEKRSGKETGQYLHKKTVMWKTFFDRLNYYQIFSVKYPVLDDITTESLISSCEYINHNFIDLLW